MSMLTEHKRPEVRFFYLLALVVFGIHVVLSTILRADSGKQLKPRCLPLRYGGAGRFNVTRPDPRGNFSLKPEIVVLFKPRNLGYFATP